MAESVSGGVAEEPEGGALAFVAAPEDEDARLDVFLAARIEGLSRTAVKRLADDGDVLVEGRPAKPSYKLRAGERVEVELPAPPASDLAAEDIPLEVVFEDEDVIVVNKPAGMVVHPAAGVSSGTLANALAYRMGAGGGEGGPGAGGRGPVSESRSLSVSSTSEKHSCPSVSPTGPPAPATGPQFLRPGIVHRLDRDTSGLIVVAKTAAAHEKLSDQFRARTVFKSYAALVHGVVREEQGRVEQPLARDPRNRTRMAVVRGGREAVSVWKVRRRFARFTLLDVRIKTGRTHQIRVHLAWIKHPVVGDEVYGMGRDGAVTDTQVRARIRALGRQFLHAERLAFDHPRTGVRLMFEAPLPEELGKFLEMLEG